MTTEQEKYSKKEVISAIQWHYGMTKKESAKYFKETSVTCHNLLVDGFKENVRRFMYED